MSVRSVFSPQYFTGKVAIVTGGATGIGAAIASELCFLGCDVMIASRNEQSLQKAKENMEGNSQLIGNVSATKCNIRNDDDVENLMQATVKKYGKIDFLVNNGGGQFMCAAENISTKGWNAVIETNLTGAFNCCKYAYLTWMGDNGGSIVNILMNMWRGSPYMSHSGAARAGVSNLTKTLSLEWASSGIRINSISPGSIYSATAAENYGDLKVFDRALALQPTGRLGRPEEISGAVCFLLSPAASYITGETLKIDGAESLYKSYIEIPKHDKFPLWSWDSDDIS